MRYRGGVLKQQATERGKLLVKKPGKMRWEYTAPEKKLFVSDGRKIYSYIPQDKQVVVGTMPRDEQAPTPALFLTGKGNHHSRLQCGIRQGCRCASGLARAEANAEAARARIRIA